MFDRFEMGREVFEGLKAIDEGIVKRASEQPCRDCGGPLHRDDYPRKPRGGLAAVAAEVFDHSDRQSSVNTITTGNLASHQQVFDSFGAAIDPPTPEVTRAGCTGAEHGPWLTLRYEPESKTAGVDSGLERGRRSTRSVFPGPGDEKKVVSTS